MEILTASSFFLLFIASSMSLPDAKEVVPLGIVSPTPRTYTIELGTFEQLEVSGCSAQPCRLVAGSSVDFTLTFIPGSTAISAVYFVEFYSDGVNVWSNRLNVNEPLFPTIRKTICHGVVIPQYSKGKIGEIYISLQANGGKQVARYFNATIEG